MNETGRQWVRKLSHKHSPAYIFDQRVKTILKSLIIEELGPVYDDICEEALSIAAKEAKHYIHCCSDGKIQKKLLSSIDLHVQKLANRINNGNSSIDMQHEILEDF